MKTPEPALRPVIAHWEFPGDLEAASVYRHLTERVEAVLEATRDAAFTPEALDTLVDEAWEAFSRHSWALFRVVIEGRDTAPSLALSSLNIALTVWLQARGEGLDRALQRGLLRAALVHDVGMLDLPRGLLAKEGSLTDDERRRLQEHPRASFEKLRRWGEGWESTQMGLQHHEEWSGGGYPGGLSGAAIHPWARRAAVAVQFNARVSPRRYRRSLVGYEAVKVLVQDQGRRFDPEVVKPFVRVFGLNPPGGVVLLSDGSVARVFDVADAGPLKPRVRILIDRTGLAFRDDTGPLVALGDTPGLYVVRPVNFDDLLEARELPGPG